MNLNSSLSIPKFPLGISRDEGEPMNTLGFGHNSTLLNILALNGSIASRTWSFWQGWTGAQTQYQMDGSLVLGGYDSAKVTGQNITVPLNMSDLNCNLVNVTDIKMNLKNGSSPSLFAPFGLSRVLGCPEPHFGTVFLHSDMWDLFLEISGSTYVDRSVSSVNFYGMLVETFGAYDGDLTISIDPGLDIRIPNHQLVVPDYDINDQGQQYIKNSSNREILINQMSSNGANDNIVLGLPFFTSAYMLVDNDAQSMTLWQAQASKTQNIVPFGHPPACETTVSSHSNLPIPDPTKPTTIHSAITSSAISKGAIAGAVVGGLIGIALFICAYIWFRMRQNRRRQAAETSAQSFLAPYPYESGYQKPEMPSDRHPPQEMPLDRDPGFALAPYEMSEVRAYEELPAQRFAMELPLHGPPTPEKSRPLTLVEISGGPKTPKSRRGSRF
ncbi:hypothetical protein MMC21_000296 [Puttea exsequens]|nr:hypothetical protein [Puttea exsequens]